VFLLKLSPFFKFFFPGFQAGAKWLSVMCIYVARNNGSS